MKGMRNLIDSDYDDSEENATLNGPTDAISKND